MPFLVILFFCLFSMPGFSQDALPADSASSASVPPDSARTRIDTSSTRTADTSLARTADTSGAEDEEDGEDSVEVNADSLSALRTAYDLTGLSQHIGSNGLTLFFSFVIYNLSKIILGINRITTATYFQRRVIYTISFFFSIAFTI